MEPCLAAWPDPGLRAAAPGLTSSASFLPTLALAVMFCTRSSAASMGRVIGRGLGRVLAETAGVESLSRAVPPLDILSLSKTDPLAFSASSCTAPALLTAPGWTPSLLEIGC